MATPERPTIRSPRNLAQLRAMSDEQLEAGYDRSAPSTSTGRTFFADEIRRRAQARHDAKIADYTRRMYIVTAIIGAATIVNVALFAFTLGR